MAFPVPETLFDRFGPRLPPVPARIWMAVSAAALAAATACIAFHHPWIGGGLLLAGCVADGLGQAAGRARDGAAVALLPLGLMLASFGFALADPGRALAAMFLMFSLSVLLWVSERRVRLVHWLAAAGLLIACALPDRFSLLAYLIGIACFVKVGQVVA